MKLLIVGNKHLHPSIDFMEGICANFKIDPKDVQLMYTTCRGGVDLSAESWAEQHDIDFRLASPNWGKEGIDANHKLAERLCEDIHKALIIWDGEETDSFLTELLDVLSDEEIPVYEVIMRKW